MRGFKQVFAFTFSQHIKTRGYRVLTITLAILFLVVPAAVMSAFELFSGSGEAQAYIPTPPDTVFVVDNTSDTPADLSYLPALADTGYEETAFMPLGSLDEALSLSQGRQNSLILAIDREDGGFRLSILRPDGCALSKADAEAFGGFVSGNFDAVLLSRSGLSEEQRAALAAGISTNVEAPASSAPEDHASAESGEDAEYDEFSELRKTLSFILPYLNVLLIYFLVLFYGQSVASSVVLEKTSKLMDTFLVSVQPKSMIFGKVFAVWLASVLQALVWVVTLIGGFTLGTVAVRAINPATDMLLIRFFEIFGSISGVFSPLGAVISLLLILFGFLLYCSVAAIGGAVAGKQEDLSTTNAMFTLIVVISFLATLWGGVLGDTGVGISWMDIVPFTAILIAPSRILLGLIPVWQGLVTLVLVLAFSAAFLLIGGKIYKLMSLYKGNPPSAAKLIKMLRGK